MCNDEDEGYITLHVEVQASVLTKHFLENLVDAVDVTIAHMNEKGKVVLISDAGNCDVYTPEDGYTL